jgi:hypothetical protein
MAEDGTEEPIEQRQKRKRNFDSYVDRDVESMGERVKRTTKNLLFIYGSIECHRRRRETPTSEN